MIAIDHHRDRGHVLWKQTQVQLSVALLNHAAQQGSVVNSTLGFVNDAAIATDLGDMTGHALAFSNQIFIQFVVRILVDGRLRMGRPLSRKKATTTHRAY